MINKIIKGIITVLGLLFGVLVFIYATEFAGVLCKDNSFMWHVTGIIISSLIWGGVFFVLAPRFISIGLNFANRIELELSKMPTTKLVFGSLGLVVGLFIAYLMSGLFINIPIPFIGVILSTAVYIFMAYLGVTIATRKITEFADIQTIFKKNIEGTKEVNENRVSPKILDTSVIIDGRIADICKTGFVEGPLVIPEFVLEELRHIADSSDTLKRNRGRRGLDILNRIQKELEINVEISDKDFPDVSEVDTKLLKLAQFINGKVLTNDYNLNKVAEFQGVPVLNINELANAVKPVVLPGEEMSVLVVKEGKESGQGLAYLDDGTMIVVENGNKFISKDIDVIVTSILQTAAGRMIFAKPKSVVNKTA
ncbi:MAG: PIN/TRAM domain-containing protein [Alkaliphilus sp.]